MTRPAHFRRLAAAVCRRLRQRWPRRRRTSTAAHRNRDAAGAVLRPRTATTSSSSRSRISCSTRHTMAYRCSKISPACRRCTTELLSPWDLGGQWNKVALLSVLMDKGSAANAGAAYEGEWIMWMDDDAIFVDMRFTFPFDQYDANGVDLVMWGDETMTYVDGNSEGINTGTMLLRVTDWTRELLAAWTDLASSAVRETLTNHDQGGLVHLLHNQPEKWRAKTMLERNFTMNGH